MKKYICFLLLLITAIISCKKFVTIDTPTNELVSSSVFVDSSTAESTVIGIYSNLFMVPNMLISNGYNLFTGLAGDDLSYTGTLSDYSEIENNSIQTKNNYVYNNLWKWGYDYIYQSNACIEGLTATTSLSASQKNRLMGELKFIRALLYFHLVNLFGDIPMETTTDYQVNSIMPRTHQDSIYNQIISDLKDAETRLPEDYFNTDRTRANKYTASALLARVYLSKKQYAAAKEESNIVINCGWYSMQNIADVFLRSSNETIFQFYPIGSSSTYNSVDGTTFIPTTSASSKPNYILNNRLLQSFSSEDLRKVSWLNSKTVNGITYTYPYKYKVRTSSNITEYNIFLRLAEMYLINAEANYYIGNYSDAVNDLNIIRNRAGLSNIIYTSQTDILREIINENRWEFFAECGHRWTDLKRWGLMDEVLSSEKENYTSTDSLFPIPWSEIQLNPFLTQNSGY